MTNDQAFLKQASALNKTNGEFPDNRRAVLWTDDYSSLAGLFY